MFEFEKNEQDCKDIIVDYARNGGDGGATEKMILGVAKVNSTPTKKGPAAFDED